MKTGKLPVPVFFYSSRIRISWNPVRMMSIAMRILLLLSVLCSAEIIQGYLPDDLVDNVLEALVSLQ